jgi:CRISPR-associated protein Csd1
MILTELYQLYQRSEGLPSMHSKVKIRWLIPINVDGSLKGNFLDLKGAGKAEQRGKEFIVPDVIRAAGIKPKLLADNGEYVLGLQKEGADAKKVAERHRQFKELLQHCAETTQSPSVLAVLRFYDAWNPDGWTQEGVDPADNFTFEVHGIADRAIIPASAAESLTAVQDFWAIATADPDSPIMTCLVTGKVGPVEARLPVKIKGVPKGQTAGTSLVSANAAPFSSYGLENSLTSPISRDAGEGFGKALNDLISGDKTRVYLGPVVYTFWTREESEVDTICDCMDEDQPEEVRDLFRGATTGQHRRFGAEGDRFYALGLSASGGRAVVRSWIDVPIAEVRRNLDSWFAAQTIVDKYGQIPDRPYFSVKSLARAMYRKGEDFEMQCSSLINVALSGDRRLPGEMLARAVRRTAIEHDLPHHRAALIKLILTKNDVISPQIPMNELNLDPQFEHETDKMAYHCGRLLAHLESVQRAALGDINTTLIDRYYGAASHTPGKVFGELVKDAQAHLRKLRVTKPGVHEALQQRMEGIMVMFSPATEFPNTLTMQQQSIFSLGYYHQRASSRKEAMARKAENAAKKAEQAPENATV